MKIDISLFEKKYREKEDFESPFKDNWRAGINISPFENHTNRSGFDKNCSLQGTTGEFFRLLEDDTTREIVDFETSVEKPVREYLSRQGKLSEEKLNELIKIIRDILYVDGNLNITEVPFLKYLPRVPHSDTLAEKLVKKYDAGQKRIAAYLYSAVCGVLRTLPQHLQTNLCSKIIANALKLKDFKTSSKDRRSSEYYMLPFVRESLQRDFLWMMGQNDSYIIKNVHLPHQLNRGEEG